MERLVLAFCDDDAAFRRLMRPLAEEVLARNGLEADCVEADTAAALENALRERDAELIFLDIDMPGLDGIRFGERLRAGGCRSDIIYVSNMEDKVYEIFRVHPWSFIRKSRLAAELPAVLEEYLRSRRGRADRLLMTGEAGQTVPLEPEAVAYVEAVGKLQRVFFTDGKTEPASLRASMHELEQKLAPYGFIRVHKGFLVNYRCVKKITSRSVVLESGGDLPVGRDRLNAARESYLSLMRWKGLSP